MRLASTVSGLAFAILAGSLQAAEAVPGDNVTAPAAAPAPIPANAMHLSELLNPSDNIVDIAVRGFETGFDNALKNKSEDAALFDQNPGLREAILDAGRPIVRKHMLASVPALERRFAEFYAKNFSPEEIDQLTSFYTTPTGAKVIAGMYAGADLAKLADSMGKDTQGPVTPDAIGQVSGSAVAKLLPTFDADDWKALFIFSATPVYAKLKSTVPEFRKLMADMANEADPAMDAEMDEAARAAVRKYMAQKKTRHSS